MRANLAFLALLVGCGGSVDAGTTTGIGSSGASTVGGSATGGRSYVPFPGAGGTVNASSGGAPTGGTNGNGVGGASALAANGGSSATGGVSGSNSSNGGTTNCVPKACEQLCPTPVGGKAQCAAKLDPVIYAIACPHSDACGGTVICYCHPA